ncbi:MAG: M20 family metallopeptidase [Armatimonadota bacterium]
MSDALHWMRRRALEMTDALVGWRRHLHMCPEPSMAEHETARFVAERLREIGIEQVREGIGETGVVGIVSGRGERCVALRADMDALEMTEETGAGYASQRPGLMHACGHDAHVACLLGAAALLREMGERLPGQVKLLFQPGEEGAAGALRMINDGVLRDPEVSAIAALHVLPDIPSGAVGLNRGFVTAQSDDVTLVVIGAAAHAAHPDQGVDAISLAAQALGAIQQFVTRGTDPVHRKVVTFGTIQGGTRRNVLAERVELAGTVRTYEASTRERILDFIGNRLGAIVAELGGRLEAHIVEGYPPLCNDDWVVDCAQEAAREVLGEERVLELEYPGLGCEDFAFFPQVGGIPAAMLRLGTRDEKRGLTWPLHSTRYDLDDESVLPVGAAVLANTAVTMLAG